MAYTLHRFQSTLNPHLNTEHTSKNNKNKNKVKQ